MTGSTGGSEGQGISLTEMEKRIRLASNKRVSLYKNIIGQEKWISIFDLVYIFPIQYKNEISNYIG